MHLWEPFGLTYKEIEKDGFTIDAKVPLGPYGPSGKEVATQAITGINGMSLSAGQTISVASVDNSGMFIRGGTVATGSGAFAQFYGKTHANTGGFYLATPDAAGTADTNRLVISGVAATAVATWGSITHTGLVLSGNMTVTGYAFDAGAGSAQINTTGAGYGLTIQSTQDGVNGARLLLSHVSASVAVNDLSGSIIIQGHNAAAGDETYGQIDCKVTDITAGVEIAGWDFYTFNAGSQNLAMTLSGAGALWVDAYYEMTEIAAPGAGAANTARIYAVVGGDTLTDLAAVFQDGSVDIFAQEVTEPDSPIFQFPDNTELKTIMRKPDRK